MSSRRSVSEGSKRSVSPVALSGDFHNEDEFNKVSRETIFRVVSELVNFTVNNSPDKDSLLNTSQSRNKNKHKINADEPLNDSKDLPVRRSSRIQSKTVKKDENFKKSKTPRQEDTNFIDVVSVDDEMEVDKGQLETPEQKPNMTIIQSPSTKSETEGKKLKENASKLPKTPKRSNKKADKKEDVKTAEKPKPDRKRTAARKRKQELTDCNTILDEDENKKETESPNENTIFVNIIKDSSTPTTSIIRAPFVKVHEAANAETKSGDHAQPVRSDDDKSNETNDVSETSSIKPVKVKSRWWRSSELEGVLKTEPTTPSVVDPGLVAQIDVIKTANSYEQSYLKIGELKFENPISTPVEPENMTLKENPPAPKPEPVVERPVYEHIDENIYKFERKKSKSKKQVRRMICDCTLSKEELERDVLGCKEECLNRLLMIECGYRCPIGEACSNKKFQKKQNAKVEIFKAELKGWGLRALEPLSTGDFLLEFVGEVLNHKEYRQRAKQYAKDKNVHCYFMALKTDEILDATVKGNYSRFINHSCDPNCETQKWTVNGELRVGVFTKRPIAVGEEFTLDYQFQRYGREAQKCLCGSYNCCGYIGGDKQISIDAYGTSKSGTKNKKKGYEEKRRDWEDMTLEEEIEKLNGFKGLRNREETLKFARLMVRADENATRHQLLDIIIKTEEQACLRLFLDYHGLPLLWSWMTDVVDLDLKTKILQVLQLLPIPNKTMLLDSKVMSIVEKWVQECDVVKKDNSLTNFSSEGNSEFFTKKMKFSDFSDSETDSSGSQHATDSSENKSSSTKTNFSVSDISLPPPAEGDNKKFDLSPSDIPLPDTLPETKQNLSSKTNAAVENTDTLRKDVSSIGSELLCTWKNLKEVFRIPRLEQQKRRKEDEREADHGVMSRVQAEIKKPEIEITGNQIQVVIAGKTSNNMKRFDFDNPDLSFKHDHHHRKSLPKLPCVNKPIRRAEEIPQNLEEDPLLDVESPILSIVASSPIPQHSTKPNLLPIPTYLNQPPVNFPPPVLPTTAQPPPIKSSPTMFPQQIIYPQAPQVNFLNTAVPPPTITHPTNMPPPSTLLPKQHPPPPLLPQSLTSIPPPIQSVAPPSLPPPISTNYILPPNVPPPSQFVPNQTIPVSGYPPGPNPLNQNQSFYYVQQPPTVSSAPLEGNYPESVPIQSISTIPVQCGTTATPQSNSLPLPSANLQQAQLSNPIPLSSNVLPVQSINPLPILSTLPLSSTMPLSNTLPIQEMPLSNTLPIQEMPLSSSLPIQEMPLSGVLPIQEIEPSPIAEEVKPVKLPKNWRSATDSEGNTYYYHSVTRETQWDPPTADQDDDNESEDDDNSASEESESSDTPTYDEPKVSTKHSKRKSKKKKTTKAAADTSVSFPVRPEIAKKIKELFRTKMSSFIVQCLNHYRKPDCKVGRITNNEDFKYLARKLTHYIMTKEIKQLKNVEDLDCNETVTHKAKDFIKKYMSKYGAKYNRKEKSSPS